ncbi:hypothetical protein [Caulobacter segnis]
MPRPRSRHEKPTASGTRASRRQARACVRLHDALFKRFSELEKMIEERKKHTYRGAYGAISYFKPGEPIPQGYEKVHYDEDGKEKAPGLATGGSSNVVIPGEDPGPQETQALAAVPDRRATRLSGMTAFTD